MTEYTMTTKQAAASIGLTPVTIQQAIIYGVLKAEKRKAETACGLRDTYFINPSDLTAYVQYRQRRSPVTNWTEDMDAALIELRPNCTIGEVAAYLGVSRQSVKDRLRRIGFTVGKRPMLPFQIPKSGLLLAKTCVACGELLDARSYHSSAGRKSGAAACRSCTNTKPSRIRSNRSHVDIRRAINAHTREKASRHRDEWTDSDDQYVIDHSTDKSSYQVALDLGRTMNAVQHRRKILGVSEATTSIDSQKWDINFPATQQEVEAYFLGLQRAVPEELWEWDESEEKSAS